MQGFSPRITFRKKLLIYSLVVSIVPLIFVMFLVVQKVQEIYQEGLNEFFIRSSDNQEQLLHYFFDSNKSWIGSIAAQDILLKELENRVATPAAQIHSPTDSLIARLPIVSTERLFSSLTSILVQNPFIERTYIVDSKGSILVSTSTNDVGQPIENASLLVVPRKDRIPYIGKIYITSSNKRVLPLSAPLIRKKDNSVMGVLVIELNASIIRSLFEGSLNSQSLPYGDNVFRNKSYIVDHEGYLLTTRGDTFQKPVSTIPFQSCRDKGAGISGIWVSYDGKESFGVSKCIKVGEALWTLVVEESTDDAYSLRDQLAGTILLVTAITGLILILVLFQISKSITGPIRLLITGAEEFGRGNLNHRIIVKSRDELENLANSFNDMAHKLQLLVADLREDKSRLEQQKLQLDHSAQLLMKRDMDIGKINTELKEEKEIISAERNKLEIILSGIRDAVIAVDMNRTIILFNASAERLTGLKTQDVAGKTIDSVLSIDDKDGPIDVSLYCPIRIDEFEGVVFSKSDLRLTTASQKQASINLVSGKIKEGLSNNLGCILAMQDITSEKEFEEMKLDFVSMAAHELRTPLTAIRGYAELLRNGVGPTLSSEPKMYLERLVVSSENLGILIDNLLNVSRIEHGTFKVEVSPLDFSALTKNLIENFREQALTKNQKVMLEIQNEPLPLVLADRFRVGQVLSNLIGNAINYTPSGGSITVRIKRSNFFLEISVSDNGIGIPKEAIPKLFTKFFRVSGILEEGSKGTGLGLFISKSIIEMHGGTIRVESEQGHGSTFTFTLPVATEGDLQKYHHVSNQDALSQGDHHGIILNKAMYMKREHHE